jgi:hypothetical protein
MNNEWNKLKGMLKRILLGDGEYDFEVKMAHSYR